jgi:site-specific DNA-cytosine methylase|tara:strand:- start:48 stop:1238 length:1191 start_codon:yes stop_codon:yes gene_type:complete
MSYSYASIVPLIGGETIAMENVFGKRPKYILSYTPFAANDSQILEHYKNEVPYHVIDEGTGRTDYVDVVNAVCPCAGLSSLSPSSSSDNKANDWMVESAKYVLGEVKPKVFWGENAPRLASKMGAPIVKELRKVAKENGYTMSLYKTKSKLHGLSQTRDRSFYFFWKGDEIPHMNFYRRPHERIEDTIRDAFVSEDDPMNELTNKNKPTDNPFYKYVLEELEGGITHKEFQNKIEKTTNPLDYLENRGIEYAEVSEWMAANGFDKQAKRCLEIHKKLKSGGNIMRKTTEIPKDYIGAFVGHMPTCLTHPDEDRYLTIRECMAIMKLPSDFQLQGGRKNLNMICQNVPVTTAEDMAQNILDWLNGKLDTNQAEFAVFDNKTSTVQYEDVPQTLESFI